MEHTMGFATSVVADFATILVIAGIVTFIFHKIKQPLILGYLVAGIIIGPYSPPVSFIREPEVLDAIAELGVLLLLFGIGLEFPISKLRKLGLKTYAVIALFELVLMFLISFLAGKILGWGLVDCLFLGAALGSSSTVVIAKVLTSMGKMKDVSTTIMMGVLVVEDLAVVLILAVLTSVFGSETFSILDITWRMGIMLLFLVGTLVIGLAIIPRAMDRINKTKTGETHAEKDEVTILVSLGLCFGLAIISDFAGLSMAMGAFLMGIIIAESRVGEHIHHNISRIREMFGAMFFVSIGALIDVTHFAAFIGPAVVVIVAMLFGKIIGCGAGARIMGFNLSISCRVGFGLGQIGEFAFIVAKVGQDMGIVNDVLFPTIGVAVAVTTFITPYLIKFSYKIDPDSLWKNFKDNRLKAKS